MSAIEPWLDEIVTGLPLVGEAFLKRWWRLWKRTSGPRTFNLKVSLNSVRSISCTEAAVPILGLEAV